jgi:hypothetical protein
MKKLAFVTVCDPFKTLVLSGWKKLCQQAADVIQNCSNDYDQYSHYTPPISLALSPSRSSSTTQVRCFTNR